MNGMGGREVGGIETASAMLVDRSMTRSNVSSESITILPSTQLMTMGSLGNTYLRPNLATTFAGERLLPGVRAQMSGQMFFFGKHFRAQ